MVEKLGRALLVLIAPALASLAGCELIAGVRDITEVEGGDSSPDADSGDALSASDTPGTSGRDATPGDARIGVDSPIRVDSPSGTDGTAVGVEAGVDAPAVDAGLEATVAKDAQTEAEASANQDAAPPFDAAGVPYVLIDDMEFQTGQTSAPDGGNGYWFTYGDGTSGGTEVPVAGAAFTDSVITPQRDVPSPFDLLSGSESHYAAQVSGSGFASYAGMGFNFINPAGTTYKKYDASAYTGFVFWGRISSTTGTDAAATDAIVRFEVSDANTEPGQGGCTKCSDYLGKNLMFTTTWQQFTVKYTDLSQVGFGVPTETVLDAAAVYGVQFQVTTNDKPFDIWVDDIYFIKSGG